MSTEAIERLEIAQRRSLEPRLATVLNNALDKVVTARALDRLQAQLEEHDLLTLSAFSELGEHEWDVIRAHTGLTLGLCHSIKQGVANAIETSQAHPSSTTGQLKQPAHSNRSFLGVRLFLRHVISSYGVDLLFPFSAQPLFIGCVTRAVADGDELKANLLSTCELNVTMLSLLLGGLLGIVGTINIEPNNTFDQAYLCVLGVSNVTCLAALVHNVMFYPLLQAIAPGSVRAFAMAHYDVYSQSASPAPDSSMRYRLYPTRACGGRTLIEPSAARVAPEQFSPSHMPPSVSPRASEPNAPRQCDANFCFRCSAVTRLVDSCNRADLFLATVLMMVYDISDLSDSGASDLPAWVVVLVAAAPLLAGFPVFWNIGLAGRSAAHSGALDPATSFGSGGGRFSGPAEARQAMINTALEQPDLLAVYNITLPSFVDDVFATIGVPSPSRKETQVTSASSQEHTAHSHSNRTLSGSV